MATIRKNYESTVSKGQDDAGDDGQDDGADHADDSYDGFGDVDIVVEAGLREHGSEEDHLAELARVTPDAVLASNTSTSISTFAEASGRPGRSSATTFSARPT